MAANVKQILKEVLAEITPKDGVAEEVSAFLKKLNSNLKKKGIRAKAVLGGSFAKGTNLRGDHDVDIFVRFDLGYDSDKLSGLLEPCLKVWKAERIHGSRDYFQVRDSIKFEVVPVLGIKKPREAKNVTDFSPWHVDWVNKHGKKIKQEIMLAKKFLKAQGAYGAESYIKGFSGHVVDILVIHYGGFTKLLRAVSQWKVGKKGREEKQVVDPYNVYKGRALMMLNKSKLQSPLVLIDPVQPDRNASAALDEENYKKFVSAAKRFLKKPSGQFFVEKKADFSRLAGKGHLVMISAESLAGSEDVAGTKLLKAFEFLRQKLADAGFKLAEAGWQWDKNASQGKCGLSCGEPDLRLKKRAIFWFVTKQKQLPKIEVRQGPPEGREPFAADFRKKYARIGKVFVSKGRLWARVERKHRTPEMLLAFWLKDGYLKDKFRAARIKRQAE